MKKYQLLPVFFVLLFFSERIFAQNKDTVAEYLSVPGPISFDNKPFNLVRSSYIADTATASFNTYTQEYIAGDDTLSHFKTLLLINVFTGNAVIEDIANAKVAELNALKASNPFVEYKTFDNKKTGELMIDFLNSENSADGQYIDVAERSIYRYNTFKDKSGKECVILFGVVVRSYGDDVDKFLSVIKSKNRVDLIRKVGTFKIPEISIVK